MLNKQSQNKIAQRIETQDGRTLIYGYLTSFFLWAAGILFSLLACATLFVTIHYPHYTEGVEYKHGTTPLVIIGIAIILAIITTLKATGWLKKIDSKVSALIVSIYVGIAAISWAIMSNSFPDWDSKDLIVAASQLGHDYGDKWAPGAYMERFPFQTPYVVLIKILRYVFGQDQTYLAIELVNSMAAAATAFIVILYTGKIFNNEVANVSALLITLSWPIILYSTFAYGNLPAIPFALAALYFQQIAIEDRVFKYNIYAAFLITISIMLKSTMIVILMAMSIAWGVTAIRDNTKKSLAAIATTLLIYIVCTSGFNACVTHKYHVRLDNGLPKTTWIAMGLQRPQDPDVLNNSGGFNGYVWSWMNNYDPKQANRESLQSIHASIHDFTSNPLYAIRYFSHKEAWIWCDPTYESILNSNWSITADPHGKPMSSRPISPIAHSVYYGKIYKLTMFISDAMQTLTFAGVAFSLIKNRKTNINTIVSAIATTGFFLIYLLWEAKAQYAFPAALLPLPLAAAGCWGLASLIYNKIPAIIWSK
ncbi:glycosyltransferase family 39 protein [Bifidobacterium platyrrhinorum]|nr:glycosyltransferase family 39 protein [Bifidobacterium platyrrhinorum]